MEFTIKTIRYSEPREFKQWAGWELFVEQRRITSGVTDKLPKNFSKLRVHMLALVEGLVWFDRRINTYEGDIVAICVPAPIKDSIGVLSPLREDGTHAASVTCLTLMDRIRGSKAVMRFYSLENWEGWGPITCQSTDTAV